MDQVLPIQDVPYDESVEVTGDVSALSAEEYLSWVRAQSQRMPNVFRASEQVIASVASSSTAMTAMPVIEDISQCSVDLLPSIEWERDMIHDFSQLRAVS
jgi:hypothetical protein